MLNLAVMAYLPPPHFGCTQVFLENLKKFKPTHKVILYSEYPWTEEQAGWPVIPLKTSPEHAKTIVGNGRENRFATNNAAFLTGMRMAKALGVSHVCYLEIDCRVGSVGWDSVIFHEFFGLPMHTIAAGSLVCWNPFNAPLEFNRRWEELIVKTNQARNNPKRNFPIPTYGVRDQGKPSIFPNGALGVYDVAWMADLFDLNNTVDIAGKSHAWDFLIGDKIYEKFGNDCFDMVGHLHTIYSSYGDIITSEADRLTMLRNGDVVAVHQVKSMATI